MALKYGRRAPDPSAKKLFLQHYLNFSTMPSPPATLDYASKVPSWPMMLNDQLGDCVIADMGHRIALFTAYGMGQPVVLPDSAILKGYEDVGGYVPGRPGTDNGCVMTQAMAYWQTTGLAGHKIAAWAAINPKDPLEVQTAMWLFGGVDFGVSLPSNAMQQFEAGQPWADTSQPPDPSMGHAIPAVAYTPTGPVIITWARAQPCSWAWVQKYADEAYCVISAEFLARSPTPAGIDLQALLADYAAMTGQPIPPIGPPGPTPPSPPPNVSPLGSINLRGPVRPGTYNLAIGGRFHYTPVGTLTATSALPAGTLSVSSPVSFQSPPGHITRSLFEASGVAQSVMDAAERLNINPQALFALVLKYGPVVFQVISAASTKNWAEMLALVEEHGASMVRDILAALGINGVPGL